MLEDIRDLLEEEWANYFGAGLSLAHSITADQAGQVINIETLNGTVVTLTVTVTQTHD